jgi:flagella basal body P-ring formation protein FlgA
MRQARAINSAAAAAAAVLAVAVSGAAAGEVRVWPTAAVASADVTLCDVAELTGFSREQRERLTGAVVAASPCEGGEMLVTVDEVRAALVEGGADLASVGLVGASRCRVSRPVVRTVGKPKAADVVPVARDESQVESDAAAAAKKRPAPRREATRREPASRRPAARSDTHDAQSAVPKTRQPGERTLETVLQEYLTARLSRQAGGVELRFSPANRADLMLSAERFEFTVQASGPVQPGLVTLDVEAVARDEADMADEAASVDEVDSAEVEPRRIPIVAEVAVLRAVVVARRAINRGRVVETGDLSVEERRFTSAREIGLTETSAAVGQRAREFIQPGRMLTAGLVESPPVVHRGETVTIWIRRGGVVVKSSGKAQGAGGLGDVVSVRRDGTKRHSDLIEAVVTGPATVTISGAARLASR